MFSVLDFGAIGDGETLCTASVQNAIDECSKSGGTVYFPPGKYLMGTVDLRSNINVFLDSGATILGSKNTKDDFKPDELRTDALYQDVSHSYYDHSLFVAKNVENIVFSGFGTIDMQSAWEMEDRNFGAKSKDRRRGAKMFTFVECENIVVKDLRLRNATDITLYLLGCKDVRVTNLDIVGHIDGISPDCCKNVVISDCIVRTGDDSIVVKSSYSLSKLLPCENIVINNCIISSRCNAIKLGTESNCGYKNICVSNCVIENTGNSGVALEIADGGDMRNVTISNLTMKNVGTPLFIVLCDRRRGPEGTDIGSIENIYINNIIATGPYEPWEACQQNYFTPQTYREPIIYTSSISGMEQKKIKNITLSDIYIEVPGGEKDEMNDVVVPEKGRAYPERLMFGKFPSYGFYIRHCDGLNMNNVNVTSIEKDCRRKIILDDVHNLRGDIEM